MSTKHLDWPIPLRPGFDFLNHVTDPADIEVLIALAKGLDDRKLAIEIGSWAGLSSWFLAKVFRRVHCIDHWRGNPEDRLGSVAERMPADWPFKVFCKNHRSDLFQKVFPHVGSSAQYAAVWPKSLRANMVFIDADHRYEHVKQDIALWQPFVVPGGILCGHDYGLFDGVTQAVDEMEPDGTEGTVWWKYF